MLDDLIMNNEGANANIIVTQPRRISAIGVSERIAAERCEQIGETVGYSIRLESKRSSKTRLLLCTTGVLLRRLQVDPDLASISHIFVDEGESVCSSNTSLRMNVTKHCMMALIHKCTKEILTQTSF